MSEQKCKCCDQFECNCPERCTNQQQDGIEERARVFCKTTTRCFGEDGQPLSAEQMMSNFARTETATITAERDRLKEALASLLEASRQYELFGLRYNIDFDTQASAESYRQLSDRLGDAQAKAKALIDDD